MTYASTLKILKAMICQKEESSLKLKQLTLLCNVTVDLLSLQLVQPHTHKLQNYA